MEKPPTETSPIEEVNNTAPQPEKPEVMDESENLVIEESVEERIKKLLERRREEFELRIDNIFSEIKVIAGRTVNNKIIEQGVIENIETIKTEIERVIQGSRSIDDSINADILQDWKDSNGDVSTFDGSLSARRQSLGLFNTKKKAAIDFVLQPLPGLEAKAERLNGELKEIETKIQETNSDSDRIMNEYERIMLETWTIHDEIAKLNGRPRFENTLANGLKERLVKDIATAANHDDTEWRKVDNNTPLKTQYYDWYTRVNAFSGYEDPRKKELNS